MTPMPFAPTVPELVAANREARRRAGRQPKPCGTETAYRRHLRHGEVPCRECCDAHAAHNAAWGARCRSGAVPQSPVSEHGTTAGYRQHRARAQKPCDECREAYNAYQRARRRPC